MFSLRWWDRWSSGPLGDNKLLALFSFFLVAIVSYGVMHVYHPEKIHEATSFRPSVPIIYEKDALILNIIRTDLAPRCNVLLMASDETCGLTGPNFNQFFQYACMKIGKDVVHMINPSYNIVSGLEGKMTVNESSLFCVQPNARVQASRYRVIEAVYTNLDGAEVSKMMFIAQSVCYQHIVDVLQGYYPCPSGFMDQQHVKKVIIS